MRAITIGVGAVLAALGALLLVWVLDGVLLRRSYAGAPHPALVISWLVFGGGVTVVGRTLPRPAVIGAAVLLAAVAVIDLVGSPRLGGIPDGFVAASPYTWVAIAILGTNGLVAVLQAPRGHREPAEGGSVASG